MAEEIHLDGHAVKVLAHPLRSRLLSALRLEGPATATSLARALGTNTGATSYHLRRLAEVGLVEDDAGGSSRERRWRAVHERHSWHPSDVAGDPDATAANEWLEADGLRRLQERTRAWHERRAAWPMEWQDAAGLSDYFLDLTPDRLAAMLSEVDAVIERYRAEPSAEGSRRVFVYVDVCPDVAGDEP